MHQGQNRGNKLELSNKNGNFTKIGEEIYKFGRNRGDYAVCTIGLGVWMPLNSIYDPIKNLYISRCLHSTNTVPHKSTSCESVMLNIIKNNDVIGMQINAQKTRWHNHSHT